MCFKIANSKHLPFVYTIMSIFYLMRKSVQKNETKSNVVKQSFSAVFSFLLVYYQVYCTKILIWFLFVYYPVYCATILIWFLFVYYPVYCTSILIWFLFVYYPVYCTTNLICFLFVYYQVYWTSNLNWFFFVYYPVYCTIQTWSVSCLFTIKCTSLQT